MFTGLVEGVGTLMDRAVSPGGVRLRIVAPLAAELALGDSLAVNGVCLTVATRDGSAIGADVGPETQRITTLGVLSPGALVNLERPLRADARLGGHFVQGHVDGMGRIEALRAEADCQWLTVSYPASFARLIVLKGSIAIDGISLTVARLTGDRLEIQVVPFTIEHTNLKQARVGTLVNVECDIIGKYVARAAEVAGASPAAPS